MDRYNMPILRFISACHYIQNTILHQKKICCKLTRIKHAQRFTIEISLVKLMEWLKTTFRATRDIFQCYAELKRLPLKRQDILDYDGRNQNLYYDIIEGKRSRKKPFTDLRYVSEINCLFVRSFHIGYHTTRDPVADGKSRWLYNNQVYEMAKGAIREVEEKHPRIRSNLRLQRNEYGNRQNNRNRHNSPERTNDSTAAYDQHDSGDKNSRTIWNERNSKWLDPLL